MKRTSKYRNPVKILLTAVALIFAVIIIHTIRLNNPIYAMADFEPMETIYMIWNDEDSVVISEIAAKISLFETVTLFINYDCDEQKIRKFISDKNGNEKNIVFDRMKQKPQTSWIRDFSPIFLKNEKSLKLVKTRYWNSQVDIAEHLARQHGLKLKNSKLYSLGGTREFNGKGTGIFVESHEKYVNPEFSLNQKKYEKRLKKEFNLKKIIWLKKGIPQDELPSYGQIEKNVYPTGSNHHIDEFCRFIAPDKIMISYVSESEIKSSNILREAKIRLDENQRILQNSTDQDGNPFEIIRMPFAPVTIQPFFSTPDPNDFRTEVTSYMNFLITNHTIILPSYQHLDSTKLTRTKEEYIAKTFKKQFPEKEVIFINPGTLNSRGGGIHCITASKPELIKKPAKVFKLKIRKNKKA